MPSANEDLFDASLRHDIGVRRFTAGESAAVLLLLEKADKDLTAQIRRRLRQGRGQTTTQRMKLISQDIDKLRDQVMAQIEDRVKPNLEEFALLEHEFEKKAVQATLPLQLDFAVASAVTLRAVVREQPFSGGTNAARTLDQWFSGLRGADKRRLVEAIQLGIVQEESVDTIVRRVVGTKSKKFRDGALAITRRNAEAVVRTATNHVSNSAREEFWQANSDVFSALRWTSTLDGRTSAICRGRDGALALVDEDASFPKGAKRLTPQSARPPAHPSCRSIMVGVFFEKGVVEIMGDRPFVRDSRTNRVRQRDFRAETRDSLGKTTWKNMSVSERNNAIRNTKSRWAKANIGQVPAETTYGEWMGRQPAAFQEEVLGVTKAKLFRKGKLPLDKFLDRRGNELTLGQLADKQPEVFTLAGLDPAEF